MSLGTGCLLIWGILLGVGLVVVLIIGAGLIAGLWSVGAFDMYGGPGVAVLEVRDELMDERPILDDLEDLLDNINTEALVLRIDSPGGVITVVEEIYNAINRVADEGMPVVASMGSSAASGAYYVCLAAERIYTNNSSLTGSIGVLLEYSSAADLFQKVGVHFDTIRTGEYKGLGSLSEPLTERQREHLQSVVNDFHEQFVELVHQERNLDMATVRELADGRLFTGRQAVSLGLADEIGDLDDAIHCAAALAGVEGEPQIIRVPKERIPFLAMLDQVESAVSTAFRRKGVIPKYLLR
jgi:protease-4